jgi:hypothetical protein
MRVIGLSVLLVLKAECAEGLRWDCRSAEVGTSARPEAAQALGWAGGRSVGRVEVRFFGEFEAVEGGVPVPVRGAKQRTVLALLALHRGQPVSADRLIDALWGDGQVANPVSGQMNWERHHTEIVRTAACGNGKRATDLLREHLAGVGCDPLAFRIVAQMQQPAGMDDDFENLARQLPDCHPTRWPSS